MKVTNSCSILPMIAVVMVLPGCGSSSASAPPISVAPAPTPVPTPTPTPTPASSVSLTVVNGFGAYMSSVVAKLDASVNVTAHGVPDEFIEQAPRATQLASVGLDAAGIAARVRDVRKSDSRGARLRAG